MPWPFQTQRLYNRRRDIHDKYGGQQRSGIVTPRNGRGIFLFTGYGDTKNHYYSDRYLEDGSILYTGEGQLSDMQWKGGNRAIRNHVQDGRDLLLFANEPSGVRFKGLFVCGGWNLEQQADFAGEMRSAIVFHLVPIEAVEGIDEDPDVGNEAPTSMSPVELRILALQAASPSQSGQGSTATVYKRSAAVRNWVLRRAGGHCEACGNSAPFHTAAGRPYLEPHHIRRLSDGGPDHPAFVAAICPNCHRRAHFGGDHVSFNCELGAAIKDKEDRFEYPSRGRLYI